MQHVKSTSEIAVGSVVLTGSFYYRVTQLFPAKFRGEVWSEKDKAWRSATDVPLPSPTHPAHVVEDAANYFPF